MIFGCQLRKTIDGEDLLVQGCRQTCPVGMEGNGPEPALVLMVSDKELLLSQDELVILQACCYQGIARLLQPGLHKASHVPPSCSRQRVPEVLTDGVAVLMLLEIGLQPLGKCFISQPTAKHVHEPASLGIDDGRVKKGVDFIWMPYLHMNGLNAVCRIPMEGLGNAFALEIFQNIPGWLNGINGHIFHHVGKTLIQPEVIPPLHGHQIAEPLMGHFMGNDQGNLLAAGHTGIVIHQQEDFSVGHQAPILHSSC